MRCKLWPDTTEQEHQREMQIFSARANYLVWIAESEEGDIAGFLEAQTCNRADGCLSDSILFIEGWWVEENFRRRGVGHALMRTAEAWAREHGCQELASDTWLDNEESHAAHLSFGFEEVDRNITYMKTL